METSIGTDDLGVPPFQETPISVSLGGKQHEFKKKFDRLSSRHKNQRKAT